MDLRVGSILSCTTTAYSNVIFLLPGEGPGPSGEGNCLAHLKALQMWKGRI